MKTPFRHPVVLLCCTFFVLIPPSLGVAGEVRPEPRSLAGRESCLDRFGEQVPKATEWALMPLQTPIPRAVRDSIAGLSAALREEAAKTPQASLQAYGLAVSICQTLASVLNERDALLQRNKMLNGGGDFSDSWQKAWFDRTAVVGPMVEKSFAQFREAVRVSPPANTLVAEDRSLAFDLPSIETASSSERGDRSSAGPRASGQKKGRGPEMGNGGLNRGAYDQHRIWSSRSGPYYRWGY